MKHFCVQLVQQASRESQNKSSEEKQAPIEIQLFFTLVLASVNFNLILQIGSSAVFVIVGVIKPNRQFK